MPSRYGTVRISVRASSIRTTSPTQASVARLPAGGTGVGSLASRVSVNAKLGCTVPPLWTPSASAAVTWISYEAAVLRGSVASKAPGARATAVPVIQSLAPSGR